MTSRGDRLVYISLAGNSIWKEERDALGWVDDNIISLHRIRHSCIGRRLGSGR